MLLQIDFTCIVEALSTLTSMASGVVLSFIDTVSF
jgi:hypothetical protein